ncbi:MAG TPA: hypothetical protein VK923_11965 [Euzebyales bacterium]|nr:hypothetical protein [Euzebyales bacterium]
MTGGGLLSDRWRMKRGGRHVSGNPAVRSSGTVGANRERFSETPDQFRVRVRRDRAAGGAGVALSVVVLVLNYIMELAPSLRPLLRGHSEHYFLAALLMGGASAWIAFRPGHHASKAPVSPTLHGHAVHDGEPANAT